MHTDDKSCTQTLVFQIKVAYVDNFSQQPSMRLKLEKSNGSKDILDFLLNTFMHVVNIFLYRYIFLSVII